MADPGQIGVYFDSDGYRLLGTLFLAPGEGLKPTALLLHGMPGIEKNYDLALYLRARGWNSLIFHYRGCWGSEGVFSFQSIPSDINRATDELCGGKYSRVDPERVVLFGHSLGGWGAVMAAVADSRVRAVVTVAPISCPSDFQITMQAATEIFCPWLPGLSPEKFLDQWHQLAESFTPTIKVKEIAPRPILILHGTGDDLVSISHSEALYTSAAEPKEFRVHPEADHGFTWHRSWLHKVVLSWLEKSVM